MRKLSDVIQQLIDNSTDEQLNQDLKRIQLSLPFTAPEIMGIRWEQAHKALCNYVPSPVNDEFIKLFSIFSTKPEDEIRKTFNQ